MSVASFPQNLIWAIDPIVSSTFDLQLSTIGLWPAAPSTPASHFPSDAISPHSVFFSPHYFPTSSVRPFEPAQHPYALFCADTGCASLSLRKFSPGHVRRKSSRRMRLLSWFPDRASRAGGSVSGNRHRLGSVRRPAVPRKRRPPRLVPGQSYPYSERGCDYNYVRPASHLQDLSADYGNQACAFS